MYILQFVYHCLPVAGTRVVSNIYQHGKLLPFKRHFWSSPVVQQLWSVLWHVFDPWPRNFHLPWVARKKVIVAKGYVRAKHEEPHPREA